MRRNLTAGSCRQIVVLLLVLLLAACATPVRRVDGDAFELQQRREQALEAIDAWSLRGRLAVSGGGDGGSGQLSWRNSADRTDFEVRAPVSRQTWRLLVEPGQARIEGLEGGPRIGTDAETLLREEIGWELPLQALSAWVRGMRGPGQARIEFDADGLPAVIEQHGWVVEYRGWHRDRALPMPAKVFASRGDRRVRLVIADWQLAP